MSHSVRVTIGGVEVGVFGKTEHSAQEFPGGQGSDDESARSEPSERVHHPIPVVVEGLQPITCPVPPGPWRIAGAIVIVLLTLVVVGILARPRPR